MDERVSTTGSERRSLDTAAALALLAGALQPWTESAEVPDPASSEVLPLTSPEVRTHPPEDGAGAGDAEDTEDDASAGGAEDEPDLHPAEVERILRENPRPKTRAECAGVPRPCPYAACRYHLGVTLSTHNGRYALPQLLEHRQLLSLPERGSCVLDVIEDHPEGVSDEDVARLSGFSRLRARQIFNTATERVRRKVRTQHASLLED